MTGKRLLAKWLWLAVFVVGAIATHAVVHTKAFLIAETIGPQYVPPTTEEVYESAGIPCERPPGATTGCQELAKPSTSGSAWDRAMAESEYKSVFLSLWGAEARRKEAFEQKEVQPTAEALRTTFYIVFGVLYAGISLYFLALLKKTFDAQHRQVFGHRLRKLIRAEQLRGTFEGLSGGRKLRQAQNEFFVVKNLYENGLITEAMFLQRKDEIKTRLGSNGPFPDKDAASSR